MVLDIPEEWVVQNVPGKWVETGMLWYPWDKGRGLKSNPGGVLASHPGRGLTFIWLRPQKPNKMHGVTP